MLKNKTTCRYIMYWNKYGNHSTQKISSATKELRLFSTKYFNLYLIPIKFFFNVKISLFFINYLRYRNIKFDVLRENLDCLKKINENFIYFY